MAGTKGKSGGTRPGSGRPVLFGAKFGDYLILQRSTIAGVEFKEYTPVLGRVCDINKNEITIQIDDEILTIRFVEMDELALS